jgi:hypothetical protein
VSWTIESAHDADVSPEAVFALYADPETWSRWGHNASWAQSDERLAEGGIVRVKAGYGTVYRCVVRRFEQGRALELVVRPAGLTIINVYEVAPSARGCRVRHALEISGPIAGGVRPFLAGMYRRKLEAEVLAVIRLAAEPAGAIQVEEPSREVSTAARAWQGMGRLLRGRREAPRD